MVKKTKHYNVNDLLKKLKRKDMEIAKLKKTIDKYVEDVSIDYDLLLDEDDRHGK